MNQPISEFEAFAWIVRLLLMAVLVVMWCGCALNYAQTSTNPVCVVACTAAPPSGAASGVVIEQRNGSGKTQPNKDQP